MPAIIFEPGLKESRIRFRGLSSTDPRAEFLYSFQAVRLRYRPTYSALRTRPIAKNNSNSGLISIAI